MLETIKSQLCRPGPTPHRPANQKLPGELGEKRNERVKEGEGTERLAPPRVKRMPPKPTLLRPTLARPEKPRKKPSKKPSRKSQRGDVRTVLAGGMFPRSRAITATRRAIMPSTPPSQKTSGRRPLGTL